MSGGGNIKHKFGDERFTIYDNAEKKKKKTFEVNEISTATTRTMTMPDNDVDRGDIASAGDGSGPGS